MNVEVQIVQRLRSTVWYSLDNDLLENAEFTIERLLGITGKDDLDSVYLYGLVLYKRAKIQAAFIATANKPHAGCSYIFAKCALELELETQGIYALQKTMHLWNDESVPRDFVNYEHSRKAEPDAAAMFSLLGKLYGLTGNVKESAAHHGQALKLNPYLWDSYEQLCKSGVNVNTRSIYKAEPPSKFSLSSSNSWYGEEASTPIQKLPKQGDGPLKKPHRTADEHRLKVSSRLIQTPNNNSSGSINYNGSSPKRDLKRGKAGGVATGSSNSLYLRKKENSAQAEFQLMTLYSVLARGLKAMCRYDCFKAIRTFNQLPDSQLETPWVLSKLGRLNFEIVNYDQSERYFKRLRALDRTRVEDMDYYSTLLWHLHKDTELSFLAHELYDININCPQTWVAIGNLFSLQRETEESIKCFQRAIQIDPKFAYAYTLQGHEYVTNDAYENAIESFRKALFNDPRHYNALYGIGMVYLKLGEFGKAEYHFRRARDINPVNVILICCVGMVLEKLGRKEAALKQYELASELQPSSPLALFKKAQLLFSLSQIPEALFEFEKLKVIAPDEASVHYLLGQLYKIADRKNEAIKEFTVALNLDPKGGHLIKESLESLNEEDE